MSKTETTPEFPTMPIVVCDQSDGTDRTCYVQYRSSPDGGIIIERVLQTWPSAEETCG